MNRLYGILFIGTAGLVFVFLYFGTAFDIQPWTETGARIYHVSTNREQLKIFLAGFGAQAPVFFVVFQILQVIFAPFPGEVSGFVGGYLFGTVKGFLYSSIGLTIGSWINFYIGRFMGQRYVRKWIAPEKRARMDSLVQRQGLLVGFFLFVIPGFPKDYLCLFMGMTAMPVKVFLLMTAVGRMPGTLMLSVQGAALYGRMYGLLAGVAIVCAVMALLAYRYRERIYRWAEEQRI